jgi:hypothetical protein
VGFCAGGFGAMTVGLPSESPMMAEAVCSVLLLLLYKKGFLQCLL